MITIKRFQLPLYISYIYNNNNNNIYLYTQYIKSLTCSIIVHIQCIEMFKGRPREGANLTSKALVTALTRVKFSLLYSSVAELQHAQLNGIKTNSFGVGG